MADTCTIYGLHDEAGTIRYVGKTVHLWTRFLLHIRQGRTWVTGIKVLEWVSEDTWKEREKYWINYFRDNGLENKNPGGGGPSFVSDEVRQKISRGVSKYLTGRPKNEATKLGLSLAKLGTKHTEEAKRKIGLGALTINRTPEARVKQRNGVSRNWEHRRKLYGSTGQRIK